MTLSLCFTLGCRGLLEKGFDPFTWAGFHYRQIIKNLKKLGFAVDRQAAGSHEIWFNPATDKYTTIPNHPGDMPEGTLRAILRQAGISTDEFLNA